MDKYAFVRELMADASTVVCPACGGRGFWDNRENKKSPTGPDWKCKNKDCPGATPLKKKIPLGIWIPDDFKASEASQPQPESKRVASPYREPGQRTATVVPGGELPEPPHGGLPPDWSDVPPPELEGEELPNEAAYRALARRVAAFQAQLGKEFEMPFDGSSVNSMTATIWINNR